MSQPGKAWPPAAAWRAWVVQLGLGALLGALLVTLVFVVEAAAGWLSVEGLSAGGAAAALTESPGLPGLSLCAERAARDPRI